MRVYKIFYREWDYKQLCAGCMDWCLGGEQYKIVQADDALSAAGKLRGPSPHSRIEITSCEFLAKVQVG